MLYLSEPWISELIESPRGRLDLHAGQRKLGKKTEARIDRTLELLAFLLDERRPHLTAVEPRLSTRAVASAEVIMGTTRTR